MAPSPGAGTQTSLAPKSLKWQTPKTQTVAQGPTPIAGSCFHLPWFLQLLTSRPSSTHIWWN